jgi:hypothetical protein
MTTFATLKTDVAALYPHSDYTTALQNTFNRLCEAEIRRRVRVRAMETLDDAFAVSDFETALPSGFISMRSVSLNQANHRNLDYLPPARIRSAPVWDSSGDPIAYSLEGDNILIAPQPAAGTTLTLVYFKMFAALSADADTNWLLANAYDVYLYGNLKHAAIWALDPQAATGYEALFSKAVEDVNKEHRWSRVSGSALIRTGGSTP